MHFINRVRHTGNLLKGYFVKISPFLLVLLFLSGDDPLKLFGGKSTKNWYLLSSPSVAERDWASLPVQINP